MAFIAAGLPLLLAARDAFDKLVDAITDSADKLSGHVVSIIYRAKEKEKRVAFNVPITDLHTNATYEFDATVVGRIETQDDQGEVALLTGSISFGDKLPSSKSEGYSGKKGELSGTLLSWKHVGAMPRTSSESALVTLVAAVKSDGDEAAPADAQPTSTVSYTKVTLLVKGP